jgi:3-oxoadipate enol-lactonase
MPYAQVRGIRLYYEIHGNGPRLLFFNGSGGDLRRKPNIFDSPLAAHFEVLCHDQRGLGSTDKPETAYTMADYADDADALLGALGWKGCRVVGVSFGGMVAQEFAIRFPARVERLVLACTSSGGAGGASYPLHELADLAQDERARRVVALGDTRFDAAWQAAHPERFQTVAAMVSAADQAADETARAGMRRQLEARRGHDTYERLPQIRCPVLVCGGRYDGIAPPPNLEAITRQIRGAQLELFDGGHYFMLQDPAAFPHMIEFLNP